MRMPPSIGSLIISYFAGCSASQVDAKRRRKGYCPSLADIVVDTREFPEILMTHGAGSCPHENAVHPPLCSEDGDCSTD